MYGIFAYLQHATEAIEQVCVRLVSVQCISPCISTHHIHVCLYQVRDRLFEFLTGGAQDPETFPLVPLAARVVFGLHVPGGAARTYPPFPLGTPVCKTFSEVKYHGSVTEYKGTSDDGSPEYYHVVYSDGDEEDVDVTECIDMTQLHNHTVLETSHLVSVCGLLDNIFTSAGPAPKETVFTRAATTYGSDGPDVGHPFAGKYDILDATFENLQVHSSGNRYKFVISDPDDESTSTSATLNNGTMLVHLHPGDRLRLEVVSASLRHAYLRVPTCIGFVDVDTSDEVAVVNMLINKPLAVINMSVLGFVRADTKKFNPRPFAVAFVHLLHRHFHLATLSTCAGLTLHSKICSVHSYPLFFLCRRWFR